MGVSIVSIRNHDIFSVDLEKKYYKKQLHRS